LQPELVGQRIFRCEAPAKIKGGTVPSLYAKVVFSNA
jgi:hypothetical protein